MLFIHLHLMQGEKAEAWFVFQASREYFGVKSTAFLSASKFTKKSTHWSDELTAKYIYFLIGEAIKIAVSFSKFQCLYAILLLWDNSKHGSSVA